MFTTFLFPSPRTVFFYLSCFYLTCNSWRSSQTVLGRSFSRNVILRLVLDTDRVGKLTSVIERLRSLKAVWNDTSTSLDKFHTTYQLYIVCIYVFYDIFTSEGTGENKYLHLRKNTCLFKSNLKLIKAANPSLCYYCKDFSDSVVSDGIFLSFAKMSAEFGL